MICLAFRRLVSSSEQRRYAIVLHSIGEMFWCAIVQKVSVVSRYCWYVLQTKIVKVWQGLVPGRRVASLQGAASSPSLPNRRKLREAAWESGFGFVCAWKRHVLSLFAFYGHLWRRNAISYQDPSRTREDCKTNCRQELEFLQVQYCNYCVFYCIQSISVQWWMTHWQLLLCLFRMAAERW